MSEYEVPPYRRPPPDPILRKGRPIVNPDAPKQTTVAELMNRGQQLLLELDRQHQRLRDATTDALQPDPRAWKGVRAAKADYDKAYSELVAVSKRLNQLIQEESPELIRQNPPPRASFGLMGEDE